jgi:hypothetical protein
MTSNKIDIFFINDNYFTFSKEIYLVLKKNRKKIAQKAIIYIEPNLVLNKELEKIKNILYKFYNYVEIQEEKIDSKEYSKACKVGSKYISKLHHKKYPKFLKNLISAHMNDFVIYQFIIPYFKVKQISKKRNLINKIFTLNSCNTTSIFDRTHLFKIHKNISNQYLLKNYFSKNIVSILKKNNSLIKISKAILMNNFMHYYKFLMRLFKIFSKKTINNFENIKHSENLILITGNAEAQSLLFTKQLKNKIFLSLPLATSNLKYKVEEEYSLKFLNLYERTVWFSLTILLTLIFLPFFVILSIAEFLIITNNFDKLSILFLMYCLKSFPYYFATYKFIKRIILKFKIKNIYSSNNIDSNLSIISHVSRKYNVRHSVVQCTSLERVQLPNYCDCDEYICESQNYGEFLKQNSRYNPEKSSRISWPTPEFISYKKILEKSNKKSSAKNKKINKFLIGFPTQAEYLDLKPLLKLLIDILLQNKLDKNVLIKIKLHPREPNNSALEYKKLIENIPFVFIESEDTHLANWFANKDLIIGSSSTVLYWAQCLNIPIISVIFKKNFYLKGLLPHLPANSLEFKVNNKFKQLLKDQLMENLNRIY